MADHALPTILSNYTDVFNLLSARFTDALIQSDPAHTTLANQPTNTVRWTSAANKWQKWNGSSWVDLSSAYAINISGNAATAAALQTARTINGVSFNGTANITVTANTPANLTFNDGGSGAASGTTFNGGTARTISYNSVGAPSATGAGASGSWGINITGNAATATSAGTVTGTVASGAVGTTQALKTNNTALATTAFVDKLRNLLPSSTSGTLVATDRGCLLMITANITVPSGVFVADSTDGYSVLTIFNNTAGTLSILQGSGLTLRLAGTASAGNRTLAAYGLATIVFISPSIAVIYGGGLS